MKDSGTWACKYSAQSWQIHDETQILHRVRRTVIFGMSTSRLIYWGRQSTILKRKLGISAWQGNVSASSSTFRGTDPMLHATLQNAALSSATSTTALPSDGGGATTTQPLRRSPDDAPHGDSPERKRQTLAANGTPAQPTTHTHGTTHPTASLPQLPVFPPCSTHLHKH